MMDRGLSDTPIRAWLHRPMLMAAFTGFMMAAGMWAATATDGFTSEVKAFCSEADVVYRVCGRPSDMARNHVWPWFNPASPKNQREAAASILRRIKAVHPSASLERVPADHPLSESWNTLIRELVEMVDPNRPFFETLFEQFEVRDSPIDLFSPTVVYNVDLSTDPPTQTIDRKGMAALLQHTAKSAGTPISDIDQLLDAISTPEPVHDELRDDLREQLDLRWLVQQYWEGLIRMPRRVYVIEDAGDLSPRVDVYGNLYVAAGLLDSQNAAARTVIMTHEAAHVWRAPHEFSQFLYDNRDGLAIAELNLLRQLSRTPDESIIDLLTLQRLADRPELRRQYADIILMAESLESSRVQLLAAANEYLEITGNVDGLLAWRLYGGEREFNYLMPDIVIRSQSEWRPIFTPRNLPGELRRVLTQYRDALASYQSQYAVLLAGRLAPAGSLDPAALADEVESKLRSRGRYSLEFGKHSVTLRLLELQ